MLEAEDPEVLEKKVEIPKIEKISFPPKRIFLQLETINHKIISVKIIGYILLPSEILWAEVSKQTGASLVELHGGGFDGYPDIAQEAADKGNDDEQYIVEVWMESNEGNKSISYEMSTHSNLFHQLDCHDLAHEIGKGFSYSGVKPLGHELFSSPLANNGSTAVMVIISKKFK